MASRSDSESALKCAINPWQLWLKNCRWYNSKISEIFTKLGETIAGHPGKTMALCLLVLGTFASGLAFMKTENRTEKLYIPTDSESVRSLEKATKYGFHRPSREAEVIIIQNDENVLKRECFEDALELHRLVLAIPGYRQVCLPNLKSDPESNLSYCAREEPLWMFNYTSNFDNLLETLNSYLPTNSALFRKVFGKISSNNEGQIISANALRMVYLIRGVHLNEDVSENTRLWEKEFLNRMEDFERTRLKCGSLVYTAERSLDDTITESTGSDIKFIAFTFALMIGFAFLMLGQYRTPLTGHGLLAVGGILCVAFGIVTGFGLPMLTQIPLISIAGFLPFLTLGVGIDDMFIIVDELDRTHPDQTIPKRLGKVMAKVGPAVAMTTITDLVALAVGATSTFPGIVYFCTFGALSITFAFLFLVTLFTAFMSYDCRRMNARRWDFLPCFKMSSRRPDESVETNTVPPHTASKVMETYGKLLMQPALKLFVILLSISLLAAGIYGATFVNEHFDQRDLAKDGSAYIRFHDAVEKYFSADTQVDLIIDSIDVNYSDPITQQKINNLTQIVANNEFYRPTVISWFEELQKWYRTQNTTKSLLGSLRPFLESCPQFKKDVLFSENSSTIKASRFYCFLKGSFSSIHLRDGMTTLRDDLKDKSTLPVFTNAYDFIFYEAHLVILPETIRNLALAAASVCVVTSFFLINPLAVWLVFLSFVSLIFELLGMMYIWDVSLNSIPMVSLLMAVGFAVDYSAHVAHAYVFSTESTPEEKVVEALRTVGASVLMGGFSTFLGTVAMAFASSEIFRVFFKMFLGIVGLGLLHGLCFLPVWLSLLCRQEIAVRPHSEKKRNPMRLSVRRKSSSIQKKPDHVFSNINPATMTSNERIHDADLQA